VFVTKTYPHKNARMLPSVLITLAVATIATAHTVISYPGWRGDNLITNETWPYGMQWIYPCQ
jgi:hypothetical protein